MPRHSPSPLPPYPFHSTDGAAYRFYTAESKKLVASCASIAVTIKSVLDTPLLTDDGLLTGESETIIPIVQKKLEQEG